MKTENYSKKLKAVRKHLKEHPEIQKRYEDMVEEETKVKRKIVYKHVMNCGDFIKVYLLDKPRLNDVDDIEVEMSGYFGLNGFGIQDWEALILIEGLTEAINKKYGSIQKAIIKLKKQKKIIK